MELAIVVQMESTKSEELATVRIPFGEESPSGVYELSRREIDLSSTNNIEIAVNFNVSNCSVSFALFEGNKQLCLWSCVWQELAPYFGLRINDREFLHFYFEKHQM